MKKKILSSATADSEGIAQAGTPEWASFTIDADSTRILEADTTARNYLGILPGNPLKTGILEAQILMDDTDFKNLAQKAISEGSAILMNTPIRSAAWMGFAVDIYANTIHVGERCLLNFVLRNVQASTNDRSALSESQARFQAFFEQSPDAVYILDEEDHVLDANPAASEMLGYSREEFLQMSSVAIQRAPEFRLDHGSIVKSELVKARPFEGLDMHKDGHKIPVEVRTGRLVGTTGNLALAIVRDISERKQLTENLERRVTDRMNELATLHEVVEATSKSSQLKNMLGKTMERILKVTNGTASLLYLVNRENGNLELFVHQGMTSDQVRRFSSTLTRNGAIDMNRIKTGSLEVTRLPQNGRLPAGLKMGGTDACISLPIRFRDRFYGVLQLCKELGGRSLTQEESSLLSAVADQIGIALEITQLQKQLRAAAAREERQKLARYLHDSISQSLYSLTYLAESWRRQANSGHTEKIQEWLNELDQHVRQIIREMRLLLYELYPPDLKKMSLVEALRKRLDAITVCAGIQVDFSVENERRIPSEIEEEIYSIIQESLNNVMKHSQASSTSVCLNFLEQKVFLSISDNGMGFDTAATASSEGMGLENIRERINRLGGILELTSTPGKGTQLKVIINSSSG